MSPGEDVRDILSPTQLEQATVGTYGIQESTVRL